MTIHQIQAAPNPDKRPIYSVTSLIVYEACPLQYHTTFVRGIPPPVTRAMRRGTNIHSLIAEHFRRPQLLPGAEEPELAAMLETFRRSRFCLPPVAVEQTFVLPFDRGDVRGRIDVVLPRPDDGLEIVDFKSGAARERTELDRGLQLPLYAMAVADRCGVRPEDLVYTYYFLRDAREVSFQPTLDQFAALSRRVDEIMGAIQESRFDPSPGCDCYACRWQRRFRERRGKRSVRTDSTG